MHVRFALGHNLCLGGGPHRLTISARVWRFELLVISAVRLLQQNVVEAISEGRSCTVCCPKTVPINDSPVTMDEYNLHSGNARRRSIGHATAKKYRLTSAATQDESFASSNFLTIGLAFRECFKNGKSIQNEMVLYFSKLLVVSASRAQLPKPNMSLHAESSSYKSLQTGF